MSRKDQIESVLEKELSQAISKEVEVKDCLITIAFVKADPDLKTAQIGISVLPSNLTGTALRELKKKSGVLAQDIIKRTKWKRMPTLEWKVDRSSKRAEEIQKTIDKASRQDPSQK